MDNKLEQLIDNIKWMHLIDNLKKCHCMSQNAFTTTKFTKKCEDPKSKKIVSVLQSLRFSNANVKRVFCQLNLVRNNQRSCLKKESILKIFSAKLGLKRF